MIWFAAHVLHEPLDPWQQWLVIHLGELLEDGRPRFRQVLVIVARQNGKTHLCKILSLFWMFVECQPFVFGTSTTLEQAKKAWAGAVLMAERTPSLAAQLDAKHKRIGNGQQDFWTRDASHYMIGAADRKGGRGDSIDRAIGDELREQRNWDAYNAAYKAMNARPNGQVVYITNQGDAGAVVLHALRNEALDFLEHGEGNGRLGLFEWSAPPGTHPMDIAGWAAANPQVGRRNDYDSIRGDAMRVAKPGADPEELAGFQTEVLCMAVRQLTPAMDAAAWQRSAPRADRPVPAWPDDRRRRLAACLDLSPDGQHVDLVVAAVLDDGLIRVELAQAWDGPDALEQCRRTLKPILLTIKPRWLGWFPDGPAAAIDADLRDRSKDGGLRGWPPRGIKVAEIKAETAAVCMGFAEQVRNDRIRHCGQELLDAHVTGAGKLYIGNRWVFMRAGAAHVSGAYAVAGAVHLARTMPPLRTVVRTAHFSQT